MPRVYFISMRCSILSSFCIYFLTIGSPLLAPLRVDFVPVRRPIRFILFFNFLVMSFPECSLFCFYFFFVRRTIRSLFRKTFFMVNAPLFTPLGVNLFPVRRTMLSPFCVYSLAVGCPIHAPFGVNLFPEFFTIRFKLCKYFALMPFVVQLMFLSFLCSHCFMICFVPHKLICAYFLTMRRIVFLLLFTVCHTPPQRRKKQPFKLRCILPRIQLLYPRKLPRMRLNPLRRAGTEFISLFSRYKARTHCLILPFRHILPQTVKECPQVRPPRP